MEDFRKRTFDYSNSAAGSYAKGPMYGSQASTYHASNPQIGLHQPSNTSPAMPIGRKDNVTALAENFDRLSVQNSGYQAYVKSNSQSQRQHSDYGGVPLANGLPMSTQASDTIGRQGQAFLHNGQIVFTSPPFPHLYAQGHGNIPSSPAMYAPPGPQYMIQGGYGSAHHMVNGNSPLSQGWTSNRVPSNDMPTLITPPRDSNSSNEDDAPGTPFTQYTGYGTYQPGVTVIDRSPHSAYTWNTPSPSQQTFSMGKVQVSNTISPRLQLLVQQQPPIPKAVPAPYSPMKPLDRSLENPNGVTNVYVRGLLPTTTDEILYTLAARFGEIMSSKSIIDHTTGLCKGYGFVKYHNFKDAEDCIRGFHMLGYETSFARESFYSQLKKLSDEQNTNLYVSNLPKEMNEHELGAIFAPHKVCSARILRDGAGNGRGVGFARFESRTVCNEIIDKFNNAPVSKALTDEPHLIQIRFADTQEQKSLKQQTTAARQYRTAEYESQTSGHSQYSTSGRVSGMSVLRGQRSEDGFERFMAVAAANTVPNVKYPPTAPSPYATAVGRLETLSGHLSPIPSPTIINVNLPFIVKAEANEHPVLSTNEALKTIDMLKTDIDEDKKTATTIVSTGSAI